jgi:hypothetical protein
MIGREKIEETTGDIQQLFLESVSGINGCANENNNNM